MAITTFEPGCGTLRAQFETHGHVFVPEAYDPELVPGMIDEMALIFRKYHLGLLGEQYATVTTTEIFPKSPILTTVLNSIGAVATEQLGVELWPLPPQNKVRLTTHRMTPTARGPWHQDEPYLRHIVAVTTPVGASKLTIKNHDSSLTEHDLVAGNAVFLSNFPSRLWHFGEANGQSRIGLTASRLHTKP